MVEGQQTCPVNFALLGEFGTLDECRNVHAVGAALVSAISAAICFLPASRRCHVSGFFVASLFTAPTLALFLVEVARDIVGEDRFEALEMLVEGRGDNLSR